LGSEISRNGNKLPLFEVARVLVRFNHVARFTTTLILDAERRANKIDQMIERGVKMAKFRFVHLPLGEKSKKNVVRVKVRDLKPSKNPKGGGSPGPNTKPNVPPGPNV